MLLRTTVAPPARPPRRYELLDAALQRDMLPDALLRAGSWFGAWDRERRESAGGVTGQQERMRALIERMSSGPIAEKPESANAQHYELPAEFLGLFLGPRRKYSGCLWDEGVQTLAQAEEAMLALSCGRAGVRDGMRVLDLGCGWGSLSLWLAAHYPASAITGVSNSHRQRAWIESERDRRGLTNLEVITADVNDFEPSGRFDRVMSIEMFEHMRNWRELLRRISGWLEPETGRAFVHVFSHRTLPYRFQGTWAADRFFTEGLMPSHELMAHFQADMELRDEWIVPGTHYARTLKAWLARLDAHADEALAVLRADGRSAGEARRLLATWRLFLISTEVIWRYRGGNRWLVSHYLLAPRSAG
ncbi:MAG TPA: cyclopropane-fatty-acyl-phospholipid synthase family protein [Solirubrobacteraceae bacterium]|nr:cyclopropane-fatty-acyl-phospholipid synthase family protein [Solirubrobacteraceae bacterium]